MLKEKLSFKKEVAILLTVDFSGTIEQYALAWLKLTNNAREYPDSIYKISNGSSNLVYVICNPTRVDLVRDFCTGIVVFYDEENDSVKPIGKVIKEDAVLIGRPVYEYESTCSPDDKQWEKDIDDAVLEWLPVEME